jgi:hypothetical protein
MTFLRLAIEHLEGSSSDPVEELLPPLPIDEQPVASRSRLGFWSRIWAAVGVRRSSPRGAL